MKRIRFLLTLLFINLFTVMVYADEIDIPIEEPKSLLGTIIAVICAVISAVFLLNRKKK